jgi:hypothetical protein
VAKVASELLGGPAGQLGIDTVSVLPGGGSNRITESLRAGLPMKAIVNNDSLGQILLEQMVLSCPGRRYRARVCDPVKVPRVIQETLAFEDPALVDIGADPNVPRPPAGSPTTRPGIGPDLAPRAAAPGRHRRRAVQ